MIYKCSWLVNKCRGIVIFMISISTKQWNYLNKQCWTTHTHLWSHTQQQGSPLNPVIQRSLHHGWCLSHRPVLYQSACVLTAHSFACWHLYSLDSDVMGRLPCKQPLEQHQKCFTFLLPYCCLFPLPDTCTPTFHLQPGLVPLCSSLSSLVAVQVYTV